MLDVIMVINYSNHVYNAFYYVTSLCLYNDPVNARKG